MSPPVPIACPIRGRYRFTQEGQTNELYRTRIRGITETPRHMIDCRDYVSEWKACDENPSVTYIDAEYCETVDHTGRPVGEYGTQAIPQYITSSIICRSNNRSLRRDTYSIRVNRYILIKISLHVYSDVSSVLESKHTL